MGAIDLLDAVVHRLAGADAGALRRATWALVDDATEAAARLEAGEPSPLIVSDRAPDDASAAVPAWAEPVWNGPEVIRIGVAIERGSLEGSDVVSSAALSAAAGRPVAVHRSITAHRRGWGWPLRVGVRSNRAAELLAQINALAYLRPLFTACEVVADAPEAVDVDLLFVESDGLPFEHGAIVANAVFVLGAGSLAPEALQFCTGWLGAAAVVAVPTGGVGCFEALLRGLSHNQPFDVAVGGAAGDALLYADTSWLVLTSLREMAARWRDSLVVADDDTPLGVPDSLHRCGVGGDDLPIGRLADVMADIANRLSYSSELELATAQADVSTAAATHGLDGMRLVEQDVEAAPAPPVADAPEAHDDPDIDHIRIDLDHVEFETDSDATLVWGGGGGEEGEDAEEDMADMAEPPMVDEPPPAAAPPPPAAAPSPPFAAQPPPVVAGPPPDRFVNLRVAAIAADGTTSDDEVIAFVGGAEYRLSVAVRAKTAAGARSLTGPLVLPDVAEQTLTVVVFPKGRMDLAQKGELKIVGRGDSKFCDFDVTVPANQPSFEVVVGVFGDGPLQAGLLRGRVVAGEADAFVGEGWTFTLAALGVLGVSDAVQTMMVDDDPTTDEVTTLSLTAGQLEQSTVGEGKRALREAVLDALAAEGRRPTLKRLAPTLARLAIDGRMLRDQLLGAGPSKFDGAQLVRVFTTEAGDPLPLELVYDHPAPIDHKVPVCAPALAGATGCAADCASRGDGHVVCPFGFWGTNRVVERHRATRPDGAEPRPPGALHVSQAAVVGISAKVDAVDRAASRKIGRAFRSLVRRSTAVTDWDDWDAAVGAGAPLLALVTHTDTVEGRPALEIGDRLRPLHLIDQGSINPGGERPGPLVLLMGCDTAHIAGSYTNVVDRLHALGADVVVAMQTPVRGAQIATLMEELSSQLGDELAGPGPARVGHALQRTRAELLRSGRIIGMALVTTGDGEIELE